jgi:MOSC domain-containing protein YiiM
MSVDRPGDVVAGDSIALMERPCPQVSIAAVNGALYRGEGGAERLEMLANLPELADGMREAFASRFAANRLC